MHQCSSCPGKENLRSINTEKFEAQGYDEDDLVKYKNWCKGSDDKAVQLTTTGWLIVLSRLDREL